MKGIDLLKGRNLKKLRRDIHIKGESQVFLNNFFFIVWQKPEMVQDKQQDQYCYIEEHLREST